MSATWHPMVTMQQQVQRVVLRASDATPGIDGRLVAGLYGADPRDVRRAVELLFRAGALEGDPRSASFGALWLTDEGRRRLRAGEGSDQSAVPAPFTQPTRVASGAVGPVARSA